MNTTHYIKVTWTQVLANQPLAHADFVSQFAYDTYPFRASPEFATSMIAVLSSCAVARLFSGSDLMPFFDVRAKRNWKAIVARPGSQLLSMAIACKARILPEYFWSVHQTYWSAP